jgi:hypothetical protein
LNLPFISPAPFSSQPNDEQSRENGSAMVRSSSTAQNKSQPHPEAGSESP